jgi:hypothetical protein
MRTLLRLLVGVLKPLLVLYLARSRDNAPDESGRLVVQDTQGREVKPNDLPQGTGMLDWAIVGSEHIPRRAQELHELGRQAGAAGDYDRALHLFAQAHEEAPEWP